MPRHLQRARSERAHFRVRMATTRRDENNATCYFSRYRSSIGGVEFSEKRAPHAEAQTRESWPKMRAAKPPPSRRRANDSPTPRRKSTAKSPQAFLSTCIIPERWPRGKKEQKVIAFSSMPPRGLAMRYDATRHQAKID